MCLKESKILIILGFSQQIVSECLWGHLPPRLQCKADWTCTFFELQPGCQDVRYLQACSPLQHSAWALGVKPPCF